MLWPLTIGVGLSSPGENRCRPDANHTLRVLTDDQGKDIDMNFNHGTISMGFKYLLSVGVMVAGYDKRGPGLYYVDSDGERTSRNLYSVGSIFAYGIIRRFWQRSQI